MDASRPILQKINAFRRKYYVNKMLRGVLLTVAALSTAVLVLVLAEGWGRFGTTGRTWMFWGFVAGAAVALATQVLWPAALLLRVVPSLSDEAASRLIGKAIPEISDRLTTLLQLEGLYASASAAERSVIDAAVDQRVYWFRPLAFTGAIHIGQNLRRLWYALPPLLILGAILGVWPDAVRKPASRIMAHSQTFVAPPPFSFELLTNDLAVPSGEQLTLEVLVSGSALPERVYIEVGEQPYRMESRGDGVFSFRVPAVRSDTPFRFRALAVIGPWELLTALPVSRLKGFAIDVRCPEYTGRSNWQQTNQGDLSVPEGSIVRMQFETSDASALHVSRNGLRPAAELAGANRFTHAFRASESGPYHVVPSNTLVGATDSMSYFLSVRKDARPTLHVTTSTIPDSRKQVRFSGVAQDDYGFTRALLVVNLTRTDPAPRLSPLPLAFDSAFVAPLDLASPSPQHLSIEHVWDFGHWSLLPEDRLEYYVEVWDNDGVRGPKSTRSATYTFVPPSEETLRAEADSSSSAIQSSLKSAAEMAAELSREMDEVRDRLRQDEEIDWQDERAFEELMEQQRKLAEQLEKIRQENAEKNARRNEFSPQQERILEKQEALQELLEEVMSDELRALYDEMQRLMDEMAQDESLDELQQQLDDMAVDQESLEKELDRAMEQFKQLKWEMSMEQAMEDLEQLAEDQQNLADETSEGETPQDELQEKQEEINDAFEKIQEELAALEQQNQELENPQPFLDSVNEQEAIEEAMQESSEQLEKGKNKRASESQSEAAEKMQELAEQMEQMMAANESEQLDEDLDAIRALLENILSLSFEEETLMEALRSTRADDPRYVEHGRTQRRLKEDALMVEDSLFALSKRVVQLAAAVNREIGLVNHHMSKAIDGYGDRLTAEINSNQQYVMTSFNNLALMLDEALQQMQQAMAESEPGNGNCEKPGGNGKPSPSPSAGDMKKMQAALGKKLAEMREMGSGENKGMSPKGQRQLSKELAQMAAQQAALRKMAQQKSQAENEDGSGGGEAMGDIAKEMEALERDMINRQVDLESIERQQQIMSRLLEAEEAERIQGEDDKRKARTGDDAVRPDIPADLKEYLEEKSRSLDLLRTLPAEFLPYYHDRVNDYFNTLDPDL